LGYINSGVLGKTQEEVPENTKLTFPIYWLSQILCDVEKLSLAYSSVIEYVISIHKALGSIPKYKKKKVEKN
jgi:hypothetical protein